MVLKLLWRKPPDPYLSRALSTERFNLVSSNWRQTIKLTLPIASDPESLHALMYDRTHYSRLRWISRVAIPDGRQVFVHAIKPKPDENPIGVHVIRLSSSGSASLMVALTEKEWWGRGVVGEVRTRLMDHFSQSPKVVRFSGRVLARNVSSVYNYKKMGFRFIGYDQKVWRSTLTGDLLDTMYFEFMAEDWRAKRQLELL